MTSLTSDPGRFKSFMRSLTSKTYGDMFKISFDYIKSNPVILGALFFLFVLVVLVTFNSMRESGPEWDGILVEAHGLLMDIFLFGVLMTWFNENRNRSNQIKEYYNQLADFSQWTEREGMLRKIGIIKRLIALNEHPLRLDFINLNESSLKGLYLKEASLQRAVAIKAFFTDANLERANLMEAYLKETCLDRANLQGANLERANLQGALLHGADLRGANLSDIEGITFKQLRSAYIDKKTQLPKHIEVVWNDNGSVKDLRQKT